MRVRAVRERPALRHAAAVLATLAAVLGAADPAPARQAAAPPDIQAEAWTVVDADSGTPIASADARERRPIASATKLMTALMTLEETRPDEVFTAAGYEPAPVESQIGLRDGERMEIGRASCRERV